MGVMEPADRQTPPPSLYKTPVELAYASRSEMAPEDNLSSPASYVPQASSPSIRAWFRDFVKPPKEHILRIKESENGYTEGVLGPNRDYVDNIFDSEQERHELFNADRTLAAPRNPNRRPNPPPLTFMYGLRYQPESQPSKIESRMVFITGLAPDTTTSYITSRVRGGKLIRVATANSPPPMGHTVIIEFAEPRVAELYALFMKENISSVFPSGVQVELVNTHSYPLAIETSNDLSDGMTRLIALLDFDQPFDEFMADFEFAYGTPEEVLEDTWVDVEGVLFLLFKRITYASRYYKTAIWRKVRHDDAAFEKDKHYFAQDPCDWDVDELRGQLCLARGNYPSFLSTWRSEQSRRAAAPPVPAETAQRRETGKQPVGPTSPKPGRRVDHKRARHPNFDARAGPSSFQLLIELAPTTVPNCQEGTLIDIGLDDAMTHGSVTPPPGFTQNFTFTLSKRSTKSSNSADPISSPSPAARDQRAQSAPEMRVLATPDPKGEDKEKASAPLSAPQLSRCSNPTAHAPAEPVPKSTNAARPAEIIPAITDEDDDTLIPKYMLPQNDPAYYELLNRDHSDLVRRSEAEAIFRQQEVRSIPKDSMRARYSAFISVREEMRAYDIGEEPMPKADVADKQEEEGDQ
ncbi:hypothetical protein F4677DRAFT_449130 [Hypoxylon crocopeplum]|nr:hypothetical protein F4677DRAFT_449130 [Hypoxylon crocopeplum]